MVHSLHMGSGWLPWFLALPYTPIGADKMSVHTLSYFPTFLWPKVSWCPVMCRTKSPIALFSLFIYINVDHAEAFCYIEYYRGNCFYVAVWQFWLRYRPVLQFRWSKSPLSKSLFYCKRNSVEVRTQNLTVLYRGCLNKNLKLTKCKEPHIWKKPKYQSRSLQCRDLGPNYDFNDILICIHDMSVW